MITADNAGILQTANTAQAGRRRNAGALRQIDIGHPTIILQIAENLPVDTIQLHLARHDAPCSDVWSVSEKNLINSNQG